MPKTVVIGCLGPTLDRSDPSHRWEKWRPSVALCQQDDLVIHRYHLLTPKKHPALSDQIVSDIQAVSPETELILHPYNLQDPWDFQEVYALFYDLSQELQLNPRDHNLIHITTGSHVMQILSLIHI